LNEFPKAHPGIHLCLGDSEKNMKKNICVCLVIILMPKNIKIETAEYQLGNEKVSFDITLYCKQTKQVLFC